MNAAPAELAATLRDFPDIASCRVFAPAGSGMPSWTRGPVAVLRAAGVMPWPSFKDWPSDYAASTMVTAWLDAMPADVPCVWLTYHHEPECDGVSADEYRRRWLVLAKIARAHRFSPRVRLVPILSLYPAVHRAGDAYRRSWTAWEGVWQQWLATGAADMLGWDCYVDAASWAYPEPETFFRVPVGSAHAAGVPLVVPELGAVRVAGDAGTGRAAWLSGALSYLARAGALAVNYWQATGTNGLDYRLHDTAGATAWRTGITAARATA